MALHTFQKLPIASLSLTPSRPVTFQTESLTLNPPFLHLHRSRPIGITMSPERRRWMPVAHVVEESQESSEPEPASAGQTLSESEEQQPPASQPTAAAEKNAELSELASELKKAMQERKEKEGENLWSGVAEEIREIEWPAFGKVLGTTSVVLSVILGSSVVLLTVNAVLAEFSDKVFAGKGIQDFLG